MPLALEDFHPDVLRALIFAPVRPSRALAGCLAPSSLPGLAGRLGPSPLSGLAGRLPGLARPRLWGVEEPKADESLVQLKTIPRSVRGTQRTLEEMARLARTDAHNPKLIWWARAIVRDLPSKDYVAELRALFDYVKKNVRYTLDPAGLEWVQAPTWTLFVDGAGDCFPKGTRVLLRKGHALVPIETLKVGDEIWGRHRWSRVERTWNKGTLPTWDIVLNNGSRMRLTPDHKVWVAVCPRHTERQRPCSCPVADRDLQRVRIRDLDPTNRNLVLIHPKRVEYGRGPMDPGRAYIEGLFLSDGWGEPSRFSIAGRDGCAKESQKREVQAICERLGVATRWHERYIAVNDAEWAARVFEMGARPSRRGTHAVFKHADSLDLEPAAATQLLRGILADSGKNTHGNGRTFTTTSRELWLQTRVLLKAAGTSCSSRFVADHGGLGKNPVWRLGVRDARRGDGHAEKLLRVSDVVRDDLALPCVDIATDDHYVWLPEADWTVSNCDDHATLLAALSLALGHGAAFRTVRGDRDHPEEFSHVYALLGIRRNGQEEWYAADTTQAQATLGWEPSQGLAWGPKTWIVEHP